MEKEVLEKAEYCLNCKTKPCQQGCPLGNDIPTFIAYLKEQNIEEAYQILSKTTVLQSICGRICPHEQQCQGNCVRRFKSQPTKIGDLEAYVGDIALEKNFPFSKEKITTMNKKVAVVGGGPAGLTCAAFLARAGYRVTILEKYNQLGGLLRHGIPEFRLDRNILDKVIDKIIQLGIQVQYGKELGKNITIQELEQQYDAIFLSFGANIPAKMQIEGEELVGVYGGNELLEKEIHPNYVGKKVAVIGGGNVAMDCSRTIKRMGAEEVYVIYRRAEKQMPAEKKEIEEAKQEGVQFLFQNNIVRIQGKDKVEKIECIKTKLIKKEGETRESPVNVEGSNYEIPMDYVVMAIGSTTEKQVIETLQKEGIQISSRGYIQVNENYQTSHPKVFAGGDNIGQKATVAWAAKAGRDAAYQIEKFLGK